MAGNDTLIRIGRGVPGANKPPERKIKPQVYWILAAAVIIVFVGMATVVYFLDPPTQQVDKSAVDNRVECTTIGHAYDLWVQHQSELNVLADVDPAVADLYMATLTSDADTLYTAASGYPDQASKELAGAAAQYRLELSMVAFALQASRAVDVEHYGKARDAWTAVGTQYKLFKTATC